LAWLRVTIDTGPDSPLLTVLVPGVLVDEGAVAQEASSQVMHVVLP
jgi:hypothetical protein